MGEHAVLVYVKPLADREIDLDEIEEPLVVAVERAGVGEFDGNELAADGSDAVLYLYGPDADTLWAAVDPVLRRAPLGAGSYAIKRYGPPGAEESRVALA